MSKNRTWAAAAVSGGVLVFAMGAVGLSAQAGGEVATVAAALKADNFRLTDQNLDSHELHRLKDAKAVVLITHGNGCPVVRNFGTDLKALRAQYEPQGVEFLMLNSNLQDNRDAVRAEAKEYGFDLPILMDEHQLVGEQLGVTRTAEMFVLDPKTWKVMYRGPINDRVTYERQRASATKTWGADAIKAVMTGQAPAVREEQSVGCLIDFPQRAQKVQHTKISYAREIAPILEQKCISCHQKGGIGPMSFTSYEQVKGFSPMIREVLRTQRMPPYHADPHIGAFSDDKRLSKDQIKTLVHWIEAGAPRGEGVDPLKMARHEAPDWPLGKPDLVLKIPAYKIPASGIVDYQRPVVANPLTEGKWLKASTVKVKERQAVHHILTGYMKEMPKDGVGRESQWGASVGGYAVGSESVISPKDIGVFVPPGGAIGFQNHYTPFGKEVTEESEIALYFYKDNEKPKMVMRDAAIADFSITIPPGVERHHEVAYYTFPKEALLYSAFPHAHYRGHSSNVILRTPDGKEKMLLSVPKYDFNWQRHYNFKEPIKIPAGSKLIVNYWYDNSQRNPANPAPEKTVLWGDQSFEEMLFTNIRYRWIDETSDKMELGEQYDKQMMATRMLGILDDNVDGLIQQAELKGPMERLKPMFGVADANKDGGIDAAEFDKVQAMMQRPQRASTRQGDTAAAAPAAAAGGAGGK
jgi:peroxiredoxin